MVALGLAVLFNLPIYYMARKKQLLTTDGILMAAILGTFLFVITPLAWFLLIAFFLSSSGLSKFMSAKKEPLHEKFAKGSQRDAGQVWANGGLPALLILGYWILNASNTYDFLQLSSLDTFSPWLLAYAIAVATVNADTFATEIGTLSSSPPRNILRPWEIVSPGTSGGVSVLGTLASLLGAMEIAILYFGFSFIFNNNILAQVSLPTGVLVFLIIATLGLVGSLVDSFLGATIQEMFWCEQCRKDTEQAFHVKCQQPTKKIRGIPKFNNDVVNFVSALVASACGFLLTTTLI